MYFAVSRVFVLLFRPDCDNGTVIACEEEEED